MNFNDQFWYTYFIFHFDVCICDLLFFHFHLQILTNVKNQLSIIAQEQKTVLTPKGVIIVVAPNGTTEMEEKTVKAVLISY